MPQPHDWSANRAMWIRVLERSTGEGLEAWKRRIRRKRFADPRTLRAWLTERGVLGYAQGLLMLERFGYPAFLRASGDGLIDAQYTHRPHLRPVFDAVVASALELGDVTLRARRRYVSLVSPRRTFARLQPAGNRVDLGLRLERRKPVGRLRLAGIHEAMRLRIPLATPEDVDGEVIGWLRRAYEENS